ncbi:Hint domain-containing protein [Yoonia sediminilitoris]|uniref:Hint domain-containing protein n=1 Tax=Yoonia sediminilitoris TaxID=1286148 RepID=A0A2T6KDN1_9RHOB|nr:Hint domain-containing protein [Yoonia sediminilitoris]PUB13154.1 Hint domain-containing protein [Yoonia sediminilitoris]RCW94489.1 Hint domain-containing protein [Yoonia sediminilitoris]
MRKTAQKNTDPFHVIHVSETGICPGTEIMTLDGELPVEHLMAGDRVITRAGVAVLAGVTTRRAKVRPIVIKGGSFGHTRPGVDMTVTPATRIHVRDWRAQALFGSDSADIAAQRLADGEFVSQATWRLMQVFDLQFENESIIYANGVEIVLPAAA